MVSRSSIPSSRWVRDGRHTCFAAGVVVAGSAERGFDDEPDDGRGSEGAARMKMTVETCRVQAWVIERTLSEVPSDPKLLVVGTVIDEEVGQTFHRARRWTAERKDQD